MDPTQQDQLNQQNAFNTDLQTSRMATIGMSGDPNANASNQGAINAGDPFLSSSFDPSANTTNPISTSKQAASQPIVSPQQAMAQAINSSAVKGAAGQGSTGAQTASSTQALVDSNGTPLGQGITPPWFDPMNNATDAAMFSTPQTGASTAANTAGNSDPSTGSVSFRNNNPLNIKFGDFSKQYGAVAGTTATDGGQFA